MHGTENFREGKSFKTSKKKNFRKPQKRKQENLKKKTSEHFKKWNFKIRIYDLIVRFFSYLNDAASHAQVPRVILSHLEYLRYLAL